MKLTNLVKFSFITFSLSSSIFAQSTAERIYFLDHHLVAPQKSITIDYIFPTPQYVIECHQDVPASSLGTVDWKYKNVMYKGQIGDQRSLVLGTDDPSFKVAHEQTADTSGNLTFKNLDTDDLYITCSYNLIKKKA